MDFLKEFVTEEQENFKVFDEYIGQTILEGISDAIGHKLAMILKTNDDGDLVLPHGTYHVSYVKKAAGDVENINVSFAPSSDFVKCINGDIDILPSMDSFDATFIDYVINYIGDGVADPVKYADKINSNRVGVELSKPEAELFVNEIAKKLAKLAKEFEKPGKNIGIDIPKHGTFEFTYTDDKTTVRFIADVILKQAVKDDLHSMDEVGVAKNTVKCFRDCKAAKKSSTICLSKKR